jgi:putative ABC transport system ATP-binding protein
MDLPLLRLERVSKIHQSGRGVIEVLKEINLEIKQGEYLSVTGKSGSGKSTLLHILGALDLPSSGKIIWHDAILSDMKSKELSRWRGEHVGFVFQTFNLIPTLTVVENVELPLLLDGIPPAKRRVQALKLLEQIELKEQENQKPPTLSGGEQQRVALARALIKKPQLILADEPTGNLDEESGASIINMLEELQSEGTALVLATHDVKSASRAHRQLHMRDGELID